jgi:hypothetical protein
MDRETRTFYEFFRQQGFLPVDRDSYALFKSYDQYSMFQEMGATIITTWSFAYHGLYKIIHGYLCSGYFYEGKPVYFTVHRPPEPREYSLQGIIDMLYGLSLEARLPFLQVKFIEDRYLPEFEALKGYAIQTEFHDDDGEYAYRIEDFLNLEGGINETKRRRLKKFFTQTNISLHQITRENIGVCHEIESQWCGDKECSYCESFSGCEKNAMEIMVHIFDERIYKGVLLYCDDIPIGYGIGEIINEKLAFVYFGKSTRQNGWLYILYMMVKTLLHRVEYMNFNEDMGHPGLREFKTHLGVYAHWRKYSCTFVEKR